MSEKKRKETILRKFQPVMARFKLSEETIKQIQSMKPKFGFNGLGEVVFRRTYSRNDESWNDVVVRVMNGVMSIRKEHYYRNSLEWNDDAWQPFAKHMALAMFNMEWLPPGRGLWMMGTDFTYNRGSMALYNCSATDTIKDLVLSAEWSMDCLMNGVGVGFSTNWRGEASFPDKANPEIFIVKDSREGWVESLIQLLCAYIDSPKYGKNAFPSFDYSELRPAGSLIKGFGGRASGAGPLMKMHKRIEGYLDAFCKRRLDTTASTYQEIKDDEGKSEWKETKVKVSKEYIHTRLIADIFNAIGACVVAGELAS